MVSALGQEVVQTYPAVWANTRNYFSASWNYIFVVLWEIEGRPLSQNTQTKT